MGSILDNMENVEDAKEPIVMEANSEVKLRIIGVKTGKDKNDLDYIMPRFDIPVSEFAKDFTTFLHVPTRDLANSDKKKFERAKYAMKEFMLTFEIDPNRPGDPEGDWLGREGWAILGVQNTEEYGEQNYIKKFVTPR